MMGSKSVETIVLSIGGSLIVPKDGVNVDFLKKLNVFVRKQVRERSRRFFLVIGGGDTARRYIEAGREVVGTISNADLDWLGIHSTRLNAHLVRTIFQDIAHPRIIDNYDHKISNARESIIIGAGWKPGWSTDYCAAVLARDYQASLLINLSNIDYVYDKDPNKYKDAKVLTHVTWDYFKGIIPSQWKPGINAPFDPIASRLAEKVGTTVVVANGTNFSNLSKILNGESFKGTVITNHKIDSSYYDETYFQDKKSEYPVPFTQSFLGSFMQDVANLYRALWIKLFINPKNCLDVGCGTGRLVYFLRRMGIEAYGVDLSQYAISAAAKEIQPFLKKGTILDLPYKDDEFELVVSFDVLEHMSRSETKSAVIETIRVSRKYILHKIYTIENKWIDLMHKEDKAHASVQSQAFWINMFKTIDTISLPKKLQLQLPSFMESTFLLRKK